MNQSDTYTKLYALAIGLGVAQIAFNLWSIL
jgi:hypothetical protein